MTPTTMTFDPDDRVASWSSDGVDLVPTFDLDSNLTTGPLGGVGATFVYDSRNRLIQAGTATYSLFHQKNQTLMRALGFILLLLGFSAVISGKLESFWSPGTGWYGWHARFLGLVILSFGWFLSRKPKHNNLNEF